MNVNGTLNVDDMNYIMDKFGEILEILKKLQAQLTLLSVRIDLLEKKS